jgi:transposase
VKYGSAGKCRRRIRRKFHAERVLSRQAIHSLVNKLKPTGLLIDKKQKHKRRVLTDEKLKSMGARLEYTPRKSLKRLVQETGVSSARWATQLLKLGPYKTTVIHASLAAARPS